MSPKRLSLPRLPEKAYLLPERKIGTCNIEVERPQNWQIYENQIEHVNKKYENGNLLSLYDAIVLCRASEIPLPDWLSDALQEFFVSAIKGDFRGESGAYNSIFAVLARMPQKAFKPTQFGASKNLKRTKVKKRMFS
jgi:hypothetical protein